MLGRKTSKQDVKVDVKARKDSSSKSSDEETSRGGTLDCELTVWVPIAGFFFF
jgi:hypothetical protein